jgi:hypothetical protein
MGMDAAEDENRRKRTFEMKPACSQRPGEAWESIRLLKAIITASNKLIEDEKKKNSISRRWQSAMNVLVKIFSKNLAKPLPLTALQAAICQIWGTGLLKIHLLNDHSSRDMQV